MGRKLLFILLFVSGVMAQQKLPDFRYTQVRDNFFLLQVFTEAGKLGSNMGIYVEEEDLLVIDTHFTGLYPWIRDSFKEISDNEIKYIINTHWHPDHTSGNEFLNKEGIIIAHKNALERMSTKQIGVGLGKPGVRAEFPARDLSKLPNLTFTESLDLLLDSTKIKVRHFPNAHTDGDCVVFFDELKIVYLGDLYWPDEYPFVDVYTGGNVIGLRNALQEIINSTNEDYIFISGHKGTGSHSDLISYVKMIDESVSHVKSNWKDHSTYSTFDLGDLSNWSSNLVPDSVWVKMIRKSL